MRPLLQNPPLHLFSGLATLVLIAAGVLLSAIPQWGLHPLPFFAFCAGHLVWGAVGALRGNGDVLMLNVGLSLVDVYAAGLRVGTAGGY